jgi:uncharacterized protein YueI
MLIIIQGGNDMNKKTVDDILQEGIHGPKEIKPAERKEFLGTIRERVVVVLTQAQVFQKQIPNGFMDLLKTNKEAKLYLNGHINYSHLSKFVKAADEQGIQFKIVTNKEYNSPNGLVLAYDYAINKENITLMEQSAENKSEETPKKKGFFESLKQMFKKNS